MRYRIALSLAVASALVATLVSPLGIAATEASAATPSFRVKTAAPDYMARGAGQPTLARAIAQAKSFDVIIAPAKMYAPFVAQMHAANPNLVILAYENSTFIDAGTDPRGTAEPNGWYARNCRGHKLRSTGYNAWLMDPRNISGAWFDNRISTARTLLSQSGYDGIFLDLLGPYPATGTYVYDATTHKLSRPAIPGSAPCKFWTDTAWMDTVGALSVKIRSATGKQVWGNGLNDGTAYFLKATKQIQRYTDGTMAEVFVRGEANGVKTHWPEAAWKRDVDMLIDANAHGERVLAITKLWVKATNAQVAAWHQYALATFLLGAGPSDYFEFRSNASLSSDDPWCRVALGAPTGAYAKIGGVYQRNFATGRVLVNPTGVTVRVKLGKSFTTLTGGTVTSVTLTPYTASILRSA